MKIISLSIKAMSTEGKILERQSFRLHVVEPFENYKAIFIKTR
jgi:hypothetical protein